MIKVDVGSQREEGYRLNVGKRIYEERWKERLIKEHWAECLYAPPP